MYKDVEADVNMELREKPFSIFMRLEKNKRHIANKTYRYKQQNNEMER